MRMGRISAKTLGQWLGTYESLTLTDADRLDILNGYAKVDFTKPLEPQACLRAFDLTATKLPEKPGKYLVTADTTATYIDESGETSFTQYEAAAGLHLLEGTPEGMPDSPILRQLPILHVTVATEARSDGEQILLDNGEWADLTIQHRDWDAWVVPEKALKTRVWDTYKINITSMEAADAITNLGNAVTRALWGEIAAAIVPKAFGIEEDSIQYGLTPPVGLGETPAQRYFYLDGVLIMLALLDLREAGDIKVKLPEAHCYLRFREGDTEGAELIYFSETLEDYAPINFALEGIRSKDKQMTQLNELFRLRHERDNADNAAMSLMWDFVERNRADHKAPTDPKTSGEVAGFIKQGYRIQHKMLANYQALTDWAGEPKQKEGALRKIRNHTRLAIAVEREAKALQQVQSSYVELPNNFEGLPAHFAAVPAGLEESLNMELAVDDYGFEILRVSRQPLEIRGQRAGRTHSELGILLKDKPEHIEKSVFAQRMRQLFGPHGPTWLLPQGIVSISKMYRDGGGYDAPQKAVRVYLRDWVYTMRPLQVERLKQKGISAAFRGRNPSDLFTDLLSALQGLTYEHVESANKWDQLRGFYLTTARGEDSKGPWAEIVLNPSLHRFVMGDDGLPYMASNTKAMLSYQAQSLDYTPAAQMSLEQLARINLYDKNRTTIVTPSGDGITRLRLAERFGLLKGPQEKPVHLLRRLNSILDNLGEAGVIADYKVDGREKKGGDAFGVKLLIDMHDDYRRAYNLTRKKSALHNAAKELQRPFAVPTNVAKRGRKPKPKA